MPFKILLRVVINTLIGLALVFVWLRFVNLGQILEKLKEVNILVLIPVFMFLFLSAFLRSLRLKIFLSPIKKIKVKDLFFLSGLAIMLNFFIPIRGGDIAKGLYLSNNYGLPVGKSIVWIFLDRFLDFFGAVFLATILLLFVPTKLPQNFITILVLLSIFMFITVYLTAYQRKLSKKIVDFLQSLLIVNTIKRPFATFSNFVLETLAVLKRPDKDIVSLSFLTILAYASDSVIWVLIFSSLGSIQNFFAMYLAQLLSALTYIIPAAPGYVGSAEASGLLVFSGVLGIDSNLSSSMIVLFHLLTLVFILLFGVSSIYFLKIDVKQLFSKILKKEAKS